VTTDPDKIVLELVPLPSDRPLEILAAGANRPAARPAISLHKRQTETVARSEQRQP
jgi:hypothetical protein